MFARKITVAIAATCLAGSAMADASDWFVSGGLSYLNSDNSRSTEEDYSGYLGLGYWLNEKLSMEVEYNDYSLDLVDSLGEVDISGLHANAKYYFLGNYETSPYVGMGFGLMDSDSPFGDDDDAIVDLLAGVQWVFGPRLGMRTQLGYRFDFDDDALPTSDKYEDWMLNVGLTYNFGDRVKPQPPQPAPAPAPAPRPEPPKDSDGDGVIDARDKCPGTPRGRPVDADGCEKEILITLEGVNFDFDEATLKPSAIAILNDGLKTLQEYGEVRVSIDGHTDAMGSEEYNKGLSNRRAETVYDWFVEKGIFAGRMRWEGFGESRPIATNDTQEGRAKNRRVELRIID